MERCRLPVPAPFAFAFLADPSTAPVIDPAVREYRPDHLPMAVGTRNLIRLRMWGIPLRVVSVVRDWEEGHRMVMENVKPRRPVTVTATHIFEPDGDACSYTWAMGSRPTGSWDASSAPRRPLHARERQGPAGPSARRGRRALARRQLDVGRGRPYVAPQGPAPRRWLGTCPSPNRAALRSGGGGRSRRELRQAYLAGPWCSSVRGPTTLTRSDSVTAPAVGRVRRCFTRAHQWTQ